MINSYLAAGTSTAAYQDPYFRSVVLLLPMAGTNGGTSFFDLSLSGKSVTAGGNAITSTAAFKWGRSSYRGDGSGDYLQIADSDDFHFAGGDFTMECWVNFISTAFPDGFVSFATQRQDYNTDLSFMFGYAAGGLELVYSTNGLPGGRAAFSSAWTPTTGRWYHVAVSRDGNTLRSFVDGVQIGSSTAIGTSQLHNSAQPLRVGASGIAADSLNGYLQDIRITKGIARYRSNFAIPGKAFDAAPQSAGEPYFDNVSLLLPMTGANGAQIFTDASKHAHAITAVGQAQTSTSAFRWSGSSYSGDGSGDYLTIPNSTAMLFGAGDFTIECWVRFNATSGFPTLINLSDDFGVNYSYNLLYTSNLLDFQYSLNGTTVVEYTNSWTPSINTWYHVAVCRSATRIRMFINGAELGTAHTIGTSALFASTAPIKICNAQVSCGSCCINGFVQDFRVTKGVARYTSNFPLPTGPFSRQVGGIEGDPFFDKTKLILKMDGSDGSTTFTDSSPAAHTVDSVGGTTDISTDHYKWSEYGSSVDFKSDGDIAFTDSEDWNLSDKDFTIDVFVQFRSLPTLFFGIVASRGAYSSNHGWTIGQGTSGTEFIYTTDGGAGTRITFLSTWTPIVGRWYHIAVSRYAGQVKIFINGVVNSTHSVGSAIIYNSTARLKIGSSSDPAADYFNGYMQDLRITKGTVRYWEAFPVPLLPVRTTIESGDEYFDNVSLLARMNGANAGSTFTDASPQKLTLTAAGSATTSTLASKWHASSGKFNGADTRITTGGTALAFSTADFTVEMWINRQGLNLASPGGRVCILYDARTAEPDINVLIEKVSGLSEKIELWINGAQRIVSTTDFAIGTWYHLAVVRSSGTTRLYVNGAQEGVSYTDLNNYTSTSATLGGRYTPVGDWRAWNGYIQDVRVTKGIARYSSAFTVPNKPFSNKRRSGRRLTAGADPWLSQVSLLVRFEGADGSTAFIDESPNPKTLTAVGNASLSTADKKWGISSYEGDGGGDSVTTPAHPDFNLGSGDFTIELWAKFLSTSGFPTLFGQLIDPGGASDLSFFLGYNSSNGINFAVSTTDGVSISRASTNWTPTLSTWYHIAAVRNGTNLSLYVDGISMASITISGSVWTSSSNVRVGNAHTGCGSCSLNGFIDSLRMTKGVARYTANFTPAEY